MRARQFTWFVGAAMLIASCSADDATNPGTETETPATSDTSTTSAEGPSDVTEVSVTNADGTPPAGLNVTPLAQPPVPTPDAFTPAGQTVDITIASTALSNPLRVELPGEPPPPDAFALVLHLNDAGTWEGIPAEYDDGSYVAWMGSFSPAIPGWARTAGRWFGSAVDGAADWATGRTDPPECRDDIAAYPWVAANNNPPADGAYHVCVQTNPAVDGTERVEIKLKSNRSTAMWVAVPSQTADYLWVEDSMWDIARPVLAAATGGPADKVLLGPGRELSVGYTRPTVTTAELEFFAWQDNVTHLSSLLISQLGGIDADVGTLMAAIACLDQGLDVRALSVSELMSCAQAGLGFSMSQLEAAFGRVKDQLFLTPSQTTEFTELFIKSQQLFAVADRLSKVAGVISAAEWASRGVTILNDQIASGTDMAGTYTVTLVPSGNASDSDATVTDECDISDRVIRDFSLAEPARIVCEFPTALAAFTDTSGRSTVALYTWIDGEMLLNAEWRDFERGAAVSGYGVEAVAEFSGGTADAARRLYDALGVTNTPAPTPTGEDPAAALTSVGVPSLCNHPASTATNGTVPSNDPLGSGGFWEMDLAGAVAGQLDDDPAVEYAATVNCSAGGVAWPTYLLLFDNDLSVIGYFSVSDLFPNDRVWRGGIANLTFDTSLAAEVSFEESGTGPAWRSYLVIGAGEYPCVTVGDLATGDPYLVGATGTGSCAPSNGNASAETADPVTVFTDYLLAAGARSYDEAWTMLSASYQDKYGGFGRFTSFWDGIDTVGINSTSVSTQGGTATIAADLWFRRVDGTTSAEIVEVDVTGNVISDYRFIRAH